MLQEAYDMNSLAKKVFNFEIVKEGEANTTTIQNLDVLSWDDVGLDVKFSFNNPLGMSKGYSPDVLRGSVRNESFSLFISK